MSINAYSFPNHCIKTKFASVDNHIHTIENYWSTEQKCFRFTRLMVCYGVVNLSPVVIAFVYAVYCMRTGNWDTTTWNLPLNIAFPFEATVWGWLLKWSFEISTFFTYACCMIMPTTYFACFCQYIVAICKHFELLVDDIRCDVERFQCKPTRQIHKKLSQLIEHHVNLLE